jgi:hypothetical protein
MVVQSGLIDQTCFLRNCFIARRRSTKIIAMTTATARPEYR